MLINTLVKYQEPFINVFFDKYGIIYYDRIGDFLLIIVFSFLIPEIDLLYIYLLIYIFMILINFSLIAKMTKKES